MASLDDPCLFLGTLRRPRAHGGAPLEECSSGSPSRCTGTGSGRRRRRQGRFNMARSKARAHALRERSSTVANVRVFSTRKRNADLVPRAARPPRHGLTPRSMLEFPPSRYMTSWTWRASAPPPRRLDAPELDERGPRGLGGLRNEPGGLDSPSARAMAAAPCSGGHHELGALGVLLRHLLRLDGARVLHPERQVRQRDILQHNPKSSARFRSAAPSCSPRKHGEG